MFLPWPFVPEPYPDELLSSWIARIASAHFTTVRGLLSKRLPRSVFYVKDIDIFDYTTEFWDVLSCASGYSIERINQMRMKSYEGYLQEEVAQTGRQHWIIPINETAKYGKRKQKCLRYCPLCLKEDGYFKKEWRLLYVNACLKHRCYLENECPQCGSPIILTLSSENSCHTNCFQCGCPLVERDSVLIDSKSYGLKAIRKLNIILKKGYFVIDGHWHYSIGFFDVLRIIVVHLKNRDTANRIFASECEWHNVPQDKYKQSHYLEEFPPWQLYGYISVGLHFFDKWPNSFRRFCQENGLTNKPSLLDKTNRANIPLWFLETLNEFVEVSNHVSIKELQSTKLYLANRGELNAKKLSELLGLKNGSVYRLLKTKG